ERKCLCYPSGVIAWRKQERAKNHHHISELLRQEGAVKSIMAAERNAAGPMSLGMGAGEPAPRHERAQHLGFVRYAPPPNSYHPADTVFCFSLRRAHLTGFRDRDCPDCATPSGFGGRVRDRKGQHSMRQLPPSESLSAARVAWTAIAAITPV